MTEQRQSLSVWLVPLAIIVASSLIILGGDGAREALKYDRLAIANGEWWRLISGHFAHLGGSHFALNIAGLCLIWLLLGGAAGALGWAVTLVVIVITINLGFWVLDQQMLWYVGLSGVLHGLLVAGAMAGMQRARVESLVLLGLVAAKLVYEQVAGPVPGTELASGGPVVVNAHLYGAVGGALAGIALWRSAARGGSI